MNASHGNKQKLSSWVDGLPLHQEMDNASTTAQHRCLSRLSFSATTMAATSFELVVVWMISHLYERITLLALQRQRHTGGKKWPAACSLRNIWDAVQMLFMSWNAIPRTNWMGMGSELCSGTWSWEMSERAGVRSSRTQLPFSLVTWTWGFPLEPCVNRT